MISIEKSNDQSININNLPSTLSIEKKLLSLIKADNIKNINIDIRRVIYSGLIKFLI